MAPELPYELDVVRTEAGFQALGAGWSGLYPESVPRNPFLSFEWAAVCRAHACPEAELFVVTARAGERLVGVAPLRRERLHGFRVLRFLGSGWSEYTGFLGAPDHPEAEGALLQELALRDAEWDLLLLRQLAPEFSGLARRPLPARVRGETLTVEGAPYLAYPGDWDAVRADGPSWLRKAEKEARRFQRDGGTVERHLGAAAAERMEEVAFVEAHSWQGRYGQPVFQKQSTQDLFRAALRELGANGEMELWLARMDGQPVAFALNILTPERLWVYRVAYHLEYGKYSPGSVLEVRSFRQAWEEGRREYDYLGGCEPYKLQRTNAVRPLEFLTLHPRTARGYLAYALLVAPRWRLKRFRAARAVLRILGQVRRSPQALLPWNRAVRQRVY